MEQLDAIQELFVQGEMQQAQEKVKKALASGYSAEDILYRALVPGMDIVGKKMASGEFFIPEVLLRAKIMQVVLDVLKPMLGKETGKAGTVVIGTVQGDIHNIGKNLVIILLEAAQFKVIDLGVDVPVKKFLDTVEMEKPDILGMSAMLTTTMQEMRKVIEALKASGRRESVKVMVGGAPLTPEWATAIGADAYCKDCAVATEKAKEFVAKI